MSNCNPSDTRRACAISLICARCSRCLLHCTCQPVEQQTKYPEMVEFHLRRAFFARRVVTGGSSCNR